MAISLGRRCPSTQYPGRCLAQADDEPCQARAEVIGIEDLNVRGMMSNGQLARTLADVEKSELARQLVQGQKSPAFPSWCRPIDARTMSRPLAAQKSGVALFLPFREVSTRFRRNEGS
jgi:hypothetical protein